MRILSETLPVDNEWRRVDASVQAATPNETLPTVGVDRVEASLLRGGALYLVERRTPFRPVFLFLWIPDGGEGVLVPEEVSAASRLFADVPQLIGTNREAVRYAVLLAYLARRSREALQIVRSPEEIRFRPKLSEEGVADRLRILSEYAGVIRPPQATAQGESFRVVAYAVRQMALERLTFDIEDGGQARMDVETLDRSLPTVIGA